MKQGVLTHGRVRLLLSKGHSCYRPRRTGERKRKSVRGCIVDANLSVLNLVIVKKGKVLNYSRSNIWPRIQLLTGKLKVHPRSGLQLKPKLKKCLKRDVDCTPVDPF